MVSALKKEGYKAVLAAWGREKDSSCFSAFRVPKQNELPLGTARTDDANALCFNMLAATLPARDKLTSKIDLPSNNPNGTKKLSDQNRMGRRKTSNQT